MRNWSSCGHVGDLCFACDNFQDFVNNFVYVLLSLDLL